MIPVATAAQVRSLDRAAIDGLGLPGIALMESASQALAAEVRAVLADTGGGRVLVACGGGNNGGDGFGAARWLHAWGIEVHVWALSDSSSGDAGINRSVYRQLGLPLVNPASVGDLRPYAVLVDAIFGTGLSRTVQGRLAQAITWLDQAPAPVVAADLPSGLHADTGAVLGVAVRAVSTVTFGAAKPGLYAGAGPDLAGRIVYADLGLGAVPDAPMLGAVRGAQDLSPWWPHRAPDDHKSRVGHLGIVAGSTSMAGAAVLACLGAQAAGVGLITLLAPRGALPRLTELPPEVMITLSGEGDVLVPPSSSSELQRATALLVGPGLGGGKPLSTALTEWLQACWVDEQRPMLADADALIAVAACTPQAGRVRVITPHAGEAARLLQTTAQQVQADRFQAVQALSGFGGTVLLKGRCTLIATPEQPISVNTSGSALLATAGSGDVLAGFIGGLLARGVSGHRAATLGAWLHGRAADHLAHHGATSVTASDVAHALGSAIQEMGP